LVGADFGAAVSGTGVAAMGTVCSTISNGSAGGGSSGAIGPSTVGGAASGSDGANGTGPAGGTGSVNAPTFVPHCGQNFCPVTSSELHVGHFIKRPCSSHMFVEV
jgi:hypothetical protein